MRVLVTGAKGQIGSAVASRLRDFATVIATDRTMLDLSQPDLIPDVLGRLAPDFIVNAAAYTAVDKAEEEPELARAVNAYAPGVIARWGAGSRVPLIHLSTDYVFDGSGERPWREDDQTGPLSVYGASKLAGEVAVLAANGSPLIVRTSWIYAAKGTNFLRKIAQLAQTRPELRIVSDQIGSPTSAALIADAIADVLAQGPEKFRNMAAEAKGVVHLTASGETSWHQFATEIVNGLKSRGVALAVERIVPVRSDEFPTPARRPHNSRLSLERLRAIFGITPLHWATALVPELDELAREMN